MNPIASVILPVSLKSTLNFKGIFLKKEKVLITLWIEIKVLKLFGTY